MIASHENTPPCKVYDANGLLWELMRWVDTETGEGEQIVRDKGGYIQLNPERTEVLTQKVKLPTPVLFVPHKDKVNA